MSNRPKQNRNLPTGQIDESEVEFRAQPAPIAYLSALVEIPEGGTIVEAIKTEISEMGQQGWQPVHFFEEDGQRFILMQRLMHLVPVRKQKSDLVVARGPLPPGAR